MHPVERRTENAAVTMPIKFRENNSLFFNIFGQRQQLLFKAI